MSGAFSFPVFLEVRGRHCLVVGGGHEAAAKAEALAAQGALVVVSDADHDSTARLAGLPGVELHRGPFDVRLFHGVMLAIIACHDRAKRRRIGLLAREAGVLVNAVDEVDLCDWSAPAILRRGELTVALGTGGIAPAFAARLRDQLADRVLDEHGELLEWLAELRPRIAASGRPFRERRALWYELVDGPAIEHLRAGDRPAALATLEAAVAAWEARA